MILVVGGHSRNIGKTSVVANLIAALPDFSWTAIKITQFGHGVCSANGETCECATDPDHPFALTRERDANAGTDTSRYLAAGAKESLWLRTRAGELGFALPALRRVLDRSPDVIIESNSVIQFIRPGAYLVVLDPTSPDFKMSAHHYLDRADAFLTQGNIHNPSPWPNVSLRLLDRRPFFSLEPNYGISSELLRFVQSKRTPPYAIVPSAAETY